MLNNIIKTTCLWNPPVDKSNDGNMYIWNEETQS